MAFPLFFDGLERHNKFFSFGSSPDIFSLIKAVLILEKSFLYDILYHKSPQTGRFFMPFTGTFDTLAYAKKLKAAGFTEQQAEIQAEALSEIIQDRLATKQDIEGLKRDIKELELRLKHDLTLRLGGMIVAGIAVVATLVKLL